MPMEERIMKTILHLLRKENPVPGPKPPARPPSPGGIKTPGAGGTPAGGMVCPGAGRPA
jgi:hypothetical protein